jgi:class 3 adenylate cyclase
MQSQVESISLELLSRDRPSLGLHNEVRTMNDHPSTLLDPQRILAAVVFSDAVGFSARMAADEERTLGLVERDLGLMRQICQETQGRVLKSTGDGLLMYFDNALQAVACALEIQKQLANQSKSLSDDDVLNHRIGIHLGNVYLKDNDIMGNGVNIAARLQTQAEPGGICLSKTVYDDVKKTLSVKATYLGLRELKNISEAFPVYQILLESSRTRLRSPAPPLRQEYRNRQVLLDKVSHYWIEGVLERSLQRRVALELGLDSRDDLLDRPWSLLWRRQDTSDMLPPGTQAIAKFDDLGASRSLLILGAPGSGKTTTLLEIARELIERAKYDVNLAIPVILNLSSWPGKRQAIADWLVTEIQSKYQVRREIAKTWIQDQKLLLLLDGLDEVNPRHRESCVEAINQFYQDHGQTDLIVCSRISDYEALQTRLQLQGAICLQPLTPEQVNQYFLKSGEDLAAIAQIIQEDSSLQELARSPLMLSIMSIAYQGISAHEIQRRVNAEERRQHLFDKYIERMLARRVADKPYQDQHTKHWLSELARQLVKESQTVFLIEGIQQSWLSRNSQKFEYHAKLFSSLGAVFGAIFSMILPNFTAVFEVSFSLFFITTITGAVLGFMSAVCWSVFRQAFGPRVFSPLGVFSYSVFSGAIAVLLGLGATRFYEDWIIYKKSYLIFASLETLPLLYVIYASSAIVFLVIAKTPIRSYNKLQWSWFWGKQKLIEGMLWGLAIGLILGQISIVYLFFVLSLDFGLTTMPNSIWTQFLASFILGIPLGIILQFLGGLVAFLIGGFTGTDIDKTTTTPNQGIWQALHNSLILGTVAMVLLGTLAGWVGVSISAGIALGIGVGLVSGGIAALKHGLLRLLLRSQNRIPWNYAHFLDYATSCIFVQKMGGGYIFSHRLLLEHFAAMKSQPGGQIK